MRELVLIVNDSELENLNQDEPKRVVPGDDDNVHPWEDLLAA